MWIWQDKKFNHFYHTTKWLEFRMKLRFKKFMSINKKWDSSISSRLLLDSTSFKRHQSYQNFWQTRISIMLSVLNEFWSIWVSLAIYSLYIALIILIWEKKIWETMMFRLLTICHLNITLKLMFLNYLTNWSIEKLSNSEQSSSILSRLSY